MASCNFLVQKLQLFSKICFAESLSLSAVHLLTVIGRNLVGVVAVTRGLAALSALLVAKQTKGVRFALCVYFLYIS